MFRVEIKCVRLLCIVVFFWLSWVSCNAEIRIAYSDLFPEAFDRSLSAFSDSNDLDIQATRMGSLPMMEEFLEGQFDLCILAMPEGVEMPKIDSVSFNLLPIAYKSSIIVVNKDNPIRELRLDQLSAIFGSQEGQSIKNWRDLGISGYVLSSISPYVLNEENGIAGELFRHKVLSSYDFVSSVRALNKDALITNLLSNSSAIGIVPEDPKVEELKVLYVSKDMDSIAYGPNAENIFFGDYPIKLPFYVLYNLKDSEHLLSTIAFLMGDEIEAILSESAFYSVPKVVRGKYSIDVQMYIQENEQ